MPDIFEDLIGKPFCDMGRGPECYDCWGLIMEIRGRLGFSTPDYGNGLCYDDQSVISSKISANVGDWIPTRVPGPGDIVLYKRINGHLHFGVMIDYIFFMQATRTTGAKRERIDTFINSNLIQGIYRCLI